jgi:Protein of unknown function (DUF3306)
MSEDFLSRWSRRKREAETDDGRARAAEEPQAKREPAVEEAKPAEPAASAESTLDLLKDLPPVESITAATDIRPFLAPGVPADIARAALRRAWAADPEIRNFVGLADYDWDFNAPGAMAGFDTLEMTEELRAAVLRLLGSSPEQGPGPTIDHATATQVEIAHAGQKPLAVLSIDSENPPPQEPNTFALPAGVDVAPQHEIERHNDEDSSNHRRGHGRALPR